METTNDVLAVIEQANLEKEKYKNCIRLSEVKLDDLFKVYLKVKDIHERTYDIVEEDLALDKMATFFPNISFRQFMEVKSILKDHDSLRYSVFIKNNPELLYDPTGTSQNPIECWEPLLELADAQIKLVSGMKGSECLIEAKNLTEIEKFKINSHYSMYRTLFLKKYGHLNKDYADKFKFVENGLKPLEPNYQKFLLKLLAYCYKHNDLALLDNVLTRLDYLIADTKLKHPSNVEYLNRISKIANN